MNDEGNNFGFQSSEDEDIINSEIEIESNWELHKELIILFKNQIKDSESFRKFIPTNDNTVIGKKFFDENFSQTANIKNPTNLYKEDYTSEAEEDETIGKGKPYLFIILVSKFQLDPVKEAEYEESIETKLVRALKLEKKANNTKRSKQLYKSTRAKELKLAMYMFIEKSN